MPQTLARVVYTQHMPNSVVVYPAKIRHLSCSFPRILWFTANKGTQCSLFFCVASTLHVHHLLLSYRRYPVNLLIFILFYRKKQKWVSLQLVQIVQWNRNSKFIVYLLNIFDLFPADNSIPHKKCSKHALPRRRCWRRCWMPSKICSMRPHLIAPIRAFR